MACAVARGPREIEPRFGSLSRQGMESMRAEAPTTVARSSRKKRFANFPEPCCCRAGVELSLSRRSLKQREPGKRFFHRGRRQQPTLRLAPCRPEKFPGPLAVPEDCRRLRFRCFQPKNRPPAGPQPPVLVRRERNVMIPRWLNVRRAKFMSLAWPFSRAPTQLAARCRQCAWGIPGYR